MLKHSIKRCVCKRQPKCMFRAGTKTVNDSEYGCLGLFQRWLLQVWELAAFSAGWLTGRRMFLLSQHSTSACFPSWSAILPLPAEMAGGRVPRPSRLITHISALVFILCLAGEFDFLWMILTTGTGLHSKVLPTPNLKMWFEIEHSSKDSWLVCLRTAASTFTIVSWLWKCRIWHLEDFQFLILICFSRFPAALFPLSFSNCHTLMLMLATTVTQRYKTFEDIHTNILGVQNV